MDKKAFVSAMKLLASLELGEFIEPKGIAVSRAKRVLRTVDELEIDVHCLRVLMETNKAPSDCVKVRAMMHVPHIDFFLCVIRTI